jgi:hypothetical protein
MASGDVGLLAARAIPRLLDEKASTEKHSGQNLPKVRAVEAVKAYSETV